MDTNTATVPYTATNAEQHAAGLISHLLLNSATSPAVSASTAEDGEFEVVMQMPTGVLVNFKVKVNQIPSIYDPLERYRPLIGQTIDAGQVPPLDRRTGTYSDS